MFTLLGDGHAAPRVAAFAPGSPRRAAGRGNLRIAMISEHASPLGAGAQASHVAELSGALAEEGHEVRVYTRRDSPDLPNVVGLGEGVQVVHVPAGPALQVPAHLLLPHMGDFAQWLG